MPVTTAPHFRSVWGSFFIAAALAFSPRIYAEPEGPSGTACLQAAGGREEVCVETKGYEFQVAVGDDVRDLIWTRADGREMAIGAVRSSPVDLRGPEWRRVTLQLDLEDPRRANTVTVRAYRQSGARAISVDLPRSSAQKLLAVYLPVADATVVISADGHHPATRPLPVDLTSAGTIHVLAIPRITGTVARVTSREPVSGASVAAKSEDAEFVTTTDPLGRFRLEIASGWPDALRIEAAGLAAKQLPLPKARKSYDIGMIALERGGRLLIALTEPPEEISADLLVQRERRWTTVATARVQDAVISFDRIEAGEYRLLLRGTEPLQRLTKAVTIRDGETTEETVEWQPATLTVAIRKRGGRVPPTEVVVMPSDQHWSATIMAGGEADPEYELWQSGEYLAFVGAGPSATIDRQLLPEQSEIVWDIDVPAHQVTGTVLGASGRPLENASVTLVTSQADEKTTVAATSDASGRFFFDAVPHGQQKLTAAAPGHIPGEHRFTIAETDGDYNTTIRLKKSSATRVIVGDASGRPLAGALVTDGHSATTRTDPSGEATIDLPPGEQRRIYVLPRNGSFASTTIRAGDDSPADAVRIEVPPGAATLRVTAVDKDTKPLENVFFALRANGLMIPPSIRMAMRNHRGDPLSTGPDGLAVLANFPPGLYELWPYFTRSELAAIIDGLVPAAATVLAQPGPNVVTFTFDRVKADNPAKP